MTQVNRRVWSYIKAPCRKSGMAATYGTDSLLPESPPTTRGGGAWSKRRVSAKAAEQPGN
jgi:hypothetical protein